jgi:riboflavin kinase / FMN adenylyltransferase
MQILSGLPGLLQSPKHAVLSIGNFDGVHLGHQQMLRQARKIADESKSPLVLVTFEPHPLTVLHPESAPPRLTPPELKVPLLQAQGADYLVVLPPQKEVLGLTAEDFWKILSEQIEISHLVEGSSFRFGRGARGTVAMLADWCGQTNVKLHIVDSVEIPLLDLQITAVTSSAIRFLLAYGRARDAAICLGRPYALRGPVIKGFSRGKSLGFPTANVLIEEQLVPADGVYAAQCKINDKNYPVALSIGTMPTFGRNARQIEAHLIGFDGDLYDTTLTVELLDWLREQRAYSGIEPLKLQIARDIDHVLASQNRDFTRPIASSVSLASNPPHFA